MECEYRFEKAAGIITPDKQFWNLEDEARKERFASQKKENGFDDRELWGLDYTIAAFIYPRLMRFREMKISYPPNHTPDEWSEILLKMAEAFKLIVISDSKRLSDDEYKLIDSGLDLFREYYFDLWD